MFESLLKVAKLLDDLDDVDFFVKFGPCLLQGLLLSGLFVNLALLRSPGIAPVFAVRLRLKLYKVRLSEEKSASHDLFKYSTHLS